MSIILKEIQWNSFSKLCLLGELSHAVIIIIQCKNKCHKRSQDKRAFPEGDCFQFEVDMKMGV